MTTPITDHAQSAVIALRAVREELEGLLARVDAAIRDAESVTEAVATLESGVPDSVERSRMRRFGNHGKIVCAVADIRDVPLRSICGPGAPPTAAASAARQAAIEALSGMGVSSSDIATILQITYEAVRRIVAAHKKAA